MRDVAVLVDPADYADVLAELRCAHGAASLDATRFALAQKAFTHTAAYDGAISTTCPARERPTSARAIPGAS